MGLRKFVPPLSAIVVILVVWEGAVRLLDMDVQTLPAPSRIVKAASADHVALGKATAVTMGEGLIGIVLAIVLAVAVALVLYLSPVLARTFEPLLAMSQTIPLIAVAPLIVIWFGFGPGGKIALVAVYGFFPIAIAFLQGLRDCPVEYVDVARTWGKPKLWILTRIIARTAMPEFFSGLRIAAAYMLSTAAMAEFVGAKNGLGVYILSAQSSYRTDLVFAGAVTLCVTTLAIYGSVLVAQRRILVYQEHTTMLEEARK